MFPIQSFRAMFLTQDAVIGEVLLDEADDRRLRHLIALGHRIVELPAFIGDSEL
jgi:hypothetical protein